MDPIDPIVAIITGGNKTENETIQYTPITCWNCTKLIGYVSTIGAKELFKPELIQGNIECKQCGESFMKGTG